MSKHIVEGLNKLEQAVLDKLLAGDHPTLVMLREQADHARLARREYTGVGFYCDFELVGCTPSVAIDIYLGDVTAELDGLVHDAGFVLFVRGGRICTLEGYTYDEMWPDQLGEFSLTYSDPTRKAELAKLG